MSNVMEKVKRASNSVVNAGAKQMLKMDVLFLEREINTRKQSFGIEIYDLMAELEKSEGMSDQDKEAKIRAAFDNARKDIAVIEAKKECKKEEIGVLAATQNAGAVPEPAIPPSSGAVLTTGHPDL